MNVKTRNKLNYLSETKAAIKTALIEKGQEVSEDDTFRSYADKVRGIQDAGNLPAAEDSSF